MWKRKKKISVVMTVLFLYSMLAPLALEVVSAATNPSIQEIETRNVALNATVTASGQCNTNESASSAVDGKNETKWCDNSGVAQK